MKAIFSSVEEEEQKKTAARRHSYILRRRNKGASTGSQHGSSTNSKARSSGGRDISRLKAIMGDTSTTEQVSSTKNETLISPLEEDVKHEGIDESMIIEQDINQ